MSPHSLRVPAHKLNLRYVGTGAICAIINHSSIDGSQVESHQSEDKVQNTNKLLARKIAIGANMREEPPTLQDIKHPSPKDSVATAFVLHMNAILRSIPPCPLKEKILHFMKHDWHDLKRHWKGGKVKRMEAIRSHWREIELLVGDTNDILLQEGALLLNLIMEKTNPVSEFYAEFEGLKRYIMDGMRDAAESLEVESLLLEFGTEFIHCRDEVERILASGMDGDEMSQAFETQCQKLYGRITAFVKCAPQSRFRNIFQRRSYRCLMSLQECNLPPSNTPEIAAFSKSLRTIAANIGDSELFDKLFHVIGTTLRDADGTPTPHIASRLAAECNEILFQHGHLFSPTILGVLKAQGEAALMRVSESASERLEAEKLVPFCDGLLAELIDKVSSLVHDWFGTNVKEPVPAKRDALRGSITAFDFIASVNPALAGIIRGFVDSVRVAFAGVPREERHVAALQRLLRSEIYIVNELKRSSKGAAKGELETKIQEIFTKHVNSLWPSITEGLDSRVCAALNKKYAETFATLNQTSTFGSLIRSVRKLTPDPRVLALGSYVILSSFLSGAEGAPIPDEPHYGLVEMTSTRWKQFVCPVLNRGVTYFNYWTNANASDGQRLLYACIDESSRMADKVVQVWRDYRSEGPCRSDTHIKSRGRLEFDGNFQALPDQTLSQVPYDLECTNVMQKTMQNYDQDVSNHYCGLQGEPRMWKVQASHDPNGPFTYCAGPHDTEETIRPRYRGTHDDAQYAQMMCRPAVGKASHGGIPRRLRISEATLTRETGNNLVLKGDDIGVWSKNCRETGGFKRPKPLQKDLAAEAAEKSTPLTQHVTEASLPAEETASHSEKAKDLFDGQGSKQLEETHVGVSPSVTNVATNPGTQLEPATEATPTTINTTVLDEKTTVVTQPDTAKSTPTSFRQWTTAETPLTPSTQAATSLTQSTQPSVAPQSTYILGPVSSTLAPGEHSAVTVEGVTHGLYEKTPSGIVPVRNETFDTPSPTQPATLDFTYPVYPALVTSGTTAVGKAAVQSGPWISRLAHALWSERLFESTMAVLPYAASASLLTAIAGAVYYHYGRQTQTNSDTNTLLDVNAVDTEEGEPLRSIVDDGNGGSDSAEEETSFMGSDDNFGRWIQMGAQPFRSLPRSGYNGLPKTLPRRATLIDHTHPPFADTSYTPHQGVVREQRRSVSNFQTFFS